jgi:hypothetical protein
MRKLIVLGLLAGLALAALFAIPAIHAPSPMLSEGDQAPDWGTHPLAG